jgi:hypothetical protein
LGHRLIFLLLAAAATIAASDSDETITISRVSIPLGPGETAFCVSLPEDGKTIAFQSERRGGHGKLDIWLSRLENGRWSKPYDPGPGINTASNEADAKLSADGLSMVFIRSYDLKESSQVYISHLRHGQWSEGELVPAPVSLPGALQFGVSLSRDQKRLYFSSNRKGGYGGFDHYYSDRKGDQWGEPVNLGPVINTAENEADMTVSRDGNAIIFPAKRSDSINGSTDLYISHNVNGAWSPIQNLGPRINTPGTDTCPWLGYDGETLYVSSNWDGLVAGQKNSVMSIWQFRYPAGFK